MTREKGRRAQTERRGSRAILFEATAALLAERSTIEVSLSEIAQRSGLNSALIKYYFGSKEGLLLALLDYVAEESMGELADLVRKDISADNKLKIHVHGIVNTYFRSPYLNRLINYLIAQGDASSSERVVKVFVEPIIAAYRSIVDQGVREGTFRPLNPGLLYYSVIGACEHIFYAGYSLPTTLNVAELTDLVRQQYIEHVVDLCLHGILLPKAAET